MNTEQACIILGVDIGASKDAVDKAFRKKAATMHPDVNKSDTATDDFKRLNEAHQFLKQNGTAPEPTIRFNVSSFPYVDEIDDILRRQAFDRAIRDAVNGVGFSDVGVLKQERKGKIIISFEESILGGEKEVTYQRRVKCGTCTNGMVDGGPKTLCPKCNGKKTRLYPGKEKELPCTACRATGYTQGRVMCADCSGTGIRRKEEIAMVKIPPGADSSKKVRLMGMGDYLPRFGSYSDAIFDVVVSPHREFYREGNDVVSIIDIDLLDALKGANKKVSTVKGDKTLKIKPGIRHKDSVQVKGFGVPPDGAHVFVVHVKYPDNTDALIKALEETKEDPEVISGDEGE